MFADRKTFSRRKKVAIIIVLIFVVLLGLLCIGYFSTANKIKKILPGSPIDAVTKNTPLKTVDGRTNILIFGTSYDDPSPNHSGGYLTDSLVILSVDKKTGNAYTISVPRDLWVSYDTSCNLGKSGKINATYICALDAYGKSYTDKASKALTSKVGSVVGLPIQYYVEVNYMFIKSLTDELGGIDVDVYSHDARGIYDPAVGLKLPAGVNHLDGKNALKLARARNSHGGYGLPRSNFDREINQQRIIAAAFKKASDGGALDNVDNALKLINALSGQVRTNVQTSELRDASSTAKSINTNTIISIPLTDYLSTGKQGSQSIVLPSAGLNNYSEIQQYISQELRTGQTE